MSNVIIADKLQQSESYIQWSQIDTNYTNGSDWFNKQKTDPYQVSNMMKGSYFWLCGAAYQNAWIINRK